MVRVYKSTSLVQEIPHPGTPWCIRQLPNGDIVTVCNQAGGRLRPLAPCVSGSLVCAVYALCLYLWLSGSFPSTQSVGPALLVQLRRTA